MSLCEDKKSYSKLTEFEEQTTKRPGHPAFRTFVKEAAKGEKHGIETGNRGNNHPSVQNSGQSGPAECSV